MPTAGALLLTPGAGADRDHPTLRAIDDGLGGRPPVHRADLPKQATAAVRRVEELAAEVVAERRIRPNRLALGGRSFGGRMCSMAVAGGLPAAGLVLLSYPLHPPGKPEQLRVDHFPALDVPCLFVSGTKDPFARPDELEAHTAAIPGPVTIEWVPGAHSPRGQDDRIVELVRAWLRALR